MNFYLTRAEYDLLICFFPSWMEKNWQSYVSEWTLNDINVVAKNVRHFNDLIRKVKEANTLKNTLSTLSGS